MAQGTETSGGEKLAADAEQTAAEEDVINSLYQLSFQARKSIRYHTKRKGFFDTCHGWIVAISALGGSGAFTSLISSDSVTTPAKILTGIVAVASAVDLAVGFSKKSHLYDSLQRRFSDLLSKIILANPSQKTLSELEVERLKIEKDEPATLVALELFCSNEELRAQGHEKYLRKFDLFHILFMHFASFDGWLPPLLSEKEASVEALRSAPESE